MSPQSEPTPSTNSRPECFVIMPFSEPTEGYKVGHFRRVFEDIFKPACEKAGFDAVRADDVVAANMIHLDLLKRLLDSPLVLCDLSTRNPNVLFELGLRQAFDKPVVLVREVDTLPIFDIAPLRYVDYRPTRIYHEVLEDQGKITAAILATMAESGNQQGVNSLVRLLGLTRPASLEDVAQANTDPAFQILRAELQELRFELLNIVRSRTESSNSYDLFHQQSLITDLADNSPSSNRSLLTRRTVRLFERQLIEFENLVKAYREGSAASEEVDMIFDKVSRFPPIVIGSNVLLKDTNLLEYFLERLGRFTDLSKEYRALKEQIERQ